MNHSLRCFSFHQCLHSLRRMAPVEILIIFICLIPTAKSSPRVRTQEDQHLERWEQTSGELHSGTLEESPEFSTNGHPISPGGGGGGDITRHVGGLLTRGSIPSPGEAGLLSSSMMKITGDPMILEERHGLQSRPVADVIQGSRRAFTITKLEYLKKEWCKTERFKQVIRDEGCLKRVIINRFCYGQCNSFFIPKSNRNDPDSAAFKSCAFCRPRKSSNITVTLVCPNRRPRLKRRKVLVVKQCRCMAQALD